MIQKTDEPASDTPAAAEKCQWRSALSRYSRDKKRLKWFTTCGVSTEIYNSCHNFCGLCGKVISHE